MVHCLSTFRVAIGFALAVIVAAPLFASTVLYRTDAQLIALSQRVSAVENCGGKQRRRDGHGKGESDRDAERA